MRACRLQEGCGFAADKQAPRWFCYENRADSEKYMG